LKAVTISSVLKEGIVVNTKVGSNNIWYQNIVYKCEENQISLALINSYLESTIMLGTNMLIKFANEYFEYVFEGHVSSIKAGFPSYITLKIIKGEEMINTREFPRYDIYLASEIYSAVDNTSYFSIVVNVSLGGMAFVSNHEFDYGEESDIKVFLPDNKYAYAKGKTIRKSIKIDHINYSMQFIEMTEKNSILLSDYLSFLDDDLLRLKNHFIQCIKPKL